MKILVCLKQVIDYQVRVQVNPDATGVVTDGVKMSINPFDEIALEEALRLREAGKATEVVAVSIGNASVKTQLRTGLAMGADRALHILSETAIDPLTAARVLLKIVEHEAPGLVIMGKQAIDDDCNQTGQMLAALWDRPQATFASELLVDGQTARVTREVDAGLETIEVDLPAVVTTDLRLNTPRFVKLPDIMKAKRKPLDESPIDSYGIEAANAAQALNYAQPPERKKGVMVDSISELVEAMKQRGVL